MHDGVGIDMLFLINQRDGRNGSGTGGNRVNGHDKHKTFVLDAPTSDSVDVMVKLPL